VIGELINGGGNGFILRRGKTRKFPQAAPARGGLLLEEDLAPADDPRAGLVERNGFGPGAFERELLRFARGAAWDSNRRHRTAAPEVERMPPVSLISGARKPHRKYGLCGLAPGADFTPVRLHYFSRDKEPQTQASLAVEIPLLL